MKENKKTNFLSTILVFGLLIILFGYKYSNKVEYLCLKDNTYKDTKITKDMITKCTSRGRTNKEYDIVGKCLNTNKRKERLIYPSDIEICSEDRDIITIELTDELNYYNHPESTSDKEIYYTFYVKNNMLYVKGNNKDDKLLFNQEKVDKIAKRTFSSTGDSRILILTTNGNVYISEKDPSYDFWKLKTSSIVGFELINNKEHTQNSELYGITKDNKKIRIEEEYK